MTNVKELMVNVKELTDYEYELENYEDGYLGDIISEIANNNTSTYHGEILNFISEHVEEVENAINELGWEGCGSSLEGAGQMAEYLYIQNSFDIVGALRNKVMKHLVANNIEEVTDEKYIEIVDLIEKADNNNRLDSVLDEVLTIVEVEEE